jgi:hypothetical protein
MIKSTIPLAQSPAAWRRTAIGLKRSADIIWDQWFGIFKRLEGGRIAKTSTQEAGDLILLIPSFLLLYGLSLENTLKGLLVSTDPSVAVSTVKWNIKGGGHDLCELVKKTEVPITTDEQELLNALTQAVLWAGRYPVPKMHADKSDFPIPLGPFFKEMDVTSVVRRFSDLKASCDALYLRILKKYPEEENEKT